MNLLLDTHCLIWALTDDEALCVDARKYILSANAVWFSEASIWELGLKWRKGKIALAPRKIFEAAVRDQFRPLPITLEPVFVSSELQQAHGDSFDRLLYAQAAHYGYSLLSIDRTLQAFGARMLHR